MNRLTSFICDTWPTIRSLVASAAAALIVAPFGFRLFDLVAASWTLLLGLPLAGFALVGGAVYVDALTERVAAQRRDVGARTFIVTDERIDILRKRGASAQTENLLRPLVAGNQWPMTGPAFDTLMQTTLHAAYVDDKDLILEVHDATIPIARLRTPAA